MLESSETRHPAGAALAAEIDSAAQRLAGIVDESPLQLSNRLSEQFGAEVYLKREDLQEVRSFKLRGAYYKMSRLTAEEAARGVVCASAGNHAQGVARACTLLGVRGTVFMPVITPHQKIDRVHHFGGGLVDVELVGESYDEAGVAAQLFAKRHDRVFVHPFDDLATIAGQGTIAREIVAQLGVCPDVVLVSVGGGGLIGGIASYLGERCDGATVIGAEPAGAPAMHDSLSRGTLVTLDAIDTFVDGAAVKAVGRMTLDLAQRYVDRVVLVPEGAVCTSLIALYQNEGIVAEPAGALAVAGLEHVGADLAGKRVVCVLSGGNNDILRYPEIMERSLVHQGLKHYFLVEFAQKPGQLRQFVDSALGPTDDIVRFEYMKKTNKERGAALVGIELRSQSDLEPLLQRMDEIQMKYRRLSSDELLYEHLI
ncbi:MAG TPA: threonine ammonia-lyase IlvA [Candidatus Dormibacteraeota bacterium]